MFHLRFGLSDHLKALLDFVFGSRRRVKKVRIFRAWFSHLVKRARLTVKRGAARPNGKSKPPQSPLRRAVRYRIRGAARHSTQDYAVPRRYEAHFSAVLFNESTACMLQASYWVRPIYEELLYSSSHAYQGSTVEAQRASNGLVKVISSKTGSDGDHVPQTSSSCISPLAVLGRLCSLGVTTSEYRAEHIQTHVPNVRCNIKLPGQSIDVEHLLQRFPTVLRGIVQGVFRQQAGGAWFSCRDLKLAITVLMPQSSEPHHWFGAVACREGSWPMELPNSRPLLRPVTLCRCPPICGVLSILIGGRDIGGRKVPETFRKGTLQ